MSNSDFIPTRAYLHTNVDCPKCNGLMVCSKVYHYHILCNNPNCELNGVVFEQPSVILIVIREVTEDNLKSMRPDDNSLQR